MTLDIKHWNARFISYFKQKHGACNLAEDYGIRIKRAKVKNSEWYWACVGVRHLTSIENQGNHNVFCDALDDQGTRMKGARLELIQGNQRPVYASIDKPSWEAGTNFPIWGETPSDVKVAFTDLGTNFKSDVVEGIRINHPDEPGGGNTIGHHSFYAVWQLVAATEDINDPDPDPDPVVENPKPDRGDIIQTENLTFQINKEYQVDLVIVVRHNVLGGL